MAFGLAREEFPDPADERRETGTRGRGERHNNNPGIPMCKCISSNTHITNICLVSRPGSVSGTMDPIFCLQVRLFPANCAHIPLLSPHRRAFSITPLPLDTHRIPSLIACLPCTEQHVRGTYSGARLCIMFICILENLHVQRTKKWAFSKKITRSFFPTFAQANNL